MMWPSVIGTADGLHKQNCPHQCLGSNCELDTSEILFSVYSLACRCDLLEMTDASAWRNLKSSGDAGSLCCK